MTHRLAVTEAAGHPSAGSPVAPDDECILRRDGTRSNDDRLTKKAHHAATGGSSGRNECDEPPTTKAEDDTEAEDDDTVQPNRRYLVEGGRMPAPSLRVTCSPP